MKSAATLLGTLLTLATLTASVAAQDVPRGTFSTNRFTPAPGPGNYLQVEGAQLSGHLLAGVGLTLDYAHEPFVIFDASCTDSTEEDCQVDDLSTELVSYIGTAHLFGSIVLAERLQIGINIPFHLTNGDGFAEVIRGEMVTLPGGSAFAVGDPTLSLKLRIAGSGQGFFLGATVYGSAPLAQQMAEDRFLGDESFRAGGHLIATYIKSGFHLSLNAGGFWRPESTLFSTRQAGQIVYRAAIGYEPTPLIMIFAELDGASSLKADVDEHPMEVRLAARLRFADDFTATLSGGAGVISGVGVPVFRGVLGIAYSPIRGDRDGDGFQDRDDGCPADAEDFDGWEDSDGCPEEDNDGDGVLDADDRCPDEAEDIDGYQDDDACPDRDNDNDGISDGFDSCPDRPEDMDGDRDEDGCPDDDTDRDGIPDAQDRCPTEPEDTDGFGDEDGCPENDYDSDGIPDDYDACPDVAEVMNGIEDEDGCPESDSDGDGIAAEADRCPDRAETLNGRDDDDGCPDGAALIRHQGSRIMLLEPMAFQRNNAVHAGSSPMVDAIATVLRRNPQYTRVRIESHSSGQGGTPAEQNNMTRLRAQQVLEGLVQRGIVQSRLVALGLGAQMPLGEDPVANERIEIHLEVAAGGAPATP